MIGLVRVAVALVVLGWVTVSFQIDAFLSQRPFLNLKLQVPIALAGFLLVGLASFLLARARLFRPWMAFGFTESTQPLSQAAFLLSFMLRA